MQDKNIFNKPIIHPLLAGLYPVAALLGVNIAEIEVSEALRAAGMAALGTVMLYFLLSALVRSRHLASFGLTGFLALFFSYGHVYLFLEAQGLFLGRHRYLLPVYLLILAGLYGYLYLRRHWLANATPAANRLAAILFILPFLQIGLFYANRQFGHQPVLSTSAAPQMEAKDGLPDIYFIILDGYPRKDILESTFGYDNAPFLSYLEGKGFAVAGCSQPNYQNTIASLAATLNMDYLDKGDGSYINRFQDETLSRMIQQSEVQRLVEGFGYTTVNFETGYKWLQWEGPDIFLSAFSNAQDRYQASTGLNAFELLLVKTSAALILFDLQIAGPGGGAGNFYELLAASPKNVHRQRLQFNFSLLPEIAETVPSPKFVYAHITFPHPPYLYGPEGQVLANEPQDLPAAYRDQVIYLNANLEMILDALIGNSSQPPVIILQSDHGAVLPYERLGIDRREKMAILNAMYLPGEHGSSVYQTITPVNTFRLLFDSYFGGTYGLLEDVSIYKEEPIRLPCRP